MTRKLIGKVISDKMNKTVVVAVERFKSHPLYKKRYKVTSKFHADDPNNTYRVGDKVEITETRPLSKKKRFVVSGKIDKTGSQK